MNYYSLNDYMPLLAGLLISFLFVCLIFFISYGLVPRYYYTEKISPYECGFDPFEDSRGRFEVRFYLVAILFIVFDLEIIFLLPWVLCFNAIGLYGFLVGLLFLVILTVGFAYEIFKGVIDAT
jgi:NADH-quinone oxidoreductase subunit A